MKRSLHWKFTLRSCSPFGVILGLTVCSLICDRAMAADFTFTKIADTTDGFSSFFNAPALNDRGTVAFSATLRNGSTGVFTGSGGAITPIAVSGGGNSTNPNFLSVATNPNINNSGTVVFGATTNSPNNIGIFTGSGKGLTTIAALNNSTLGTAIGLTITPAINNAGTVAFAYNSPSQPLTQYTPTVAVSNNGKISTLDLRGGYAGSGSIAPNAVGLDKSGTVFFASGVPGSMGGGSVFTPNPLAAQPNAQPLKQLAFGGYYSISVNGNGSYAASTAGAAGGTWIALGNAQNGSNANRIDGYVNYDNPALTSRVGTASINDQGRIAFAVDGNSTREGLYYFDANQIAQFTDANGATKIITVGDPLFGSRVTLLDSFPFSARGLNNADQVAFYAQLADGRSGIFLAEPIPEPHTVIPSALLLMSFGMRIMRKRRSRE